MFQPDSIKTVISTPDTAKTKKEAVKAKKATVAKVDTATSGVAKEMTKTIKSEETAMPQPATQNTLNQHTTILPTDTLSADTLLTSDSTTTIVDTIAVEPTGKIGKELPTSISNSTWMFTSFVFLLALLSIALKLEKKNLFKSIKSFFVRDVETSDSFKATNLIKPEKYFIISVFTIGVWTFAIEMLFNPLFTESIPPLSILYRAGILAVFFIVKHILFEIVGRTFFGKKATKLFKAHYFKVFFYFSILLLPILVAYIYIPEIRVIPIARMLVGTVAIAYTALLFKVLQTFYSKLLDLFYIFLYFCTLEILPLAILIGANKLIEF